MTAQRPLSPFETAYFSPGAKVGSIVTGGMPLYIGTTVTGQVDEAILRLVLDELAGAHPLLRSRVELDAAGARKFVVDNDFRPRLEVRGGGESEYLRLVNEVRTWSDGLFSARLLRENDREQIVLVIHHGIADGRSAFALLGQLWRRYSEHLTGSPSPQPATEYALPPAADVQLAEAVGSDAVADWLATVSEQVTTAGPGAVPAALPQDGAAGPLGRFTMMRIELDPIETGVIVESARAQGISVNSLFSGAAMVALRSAFDTQGPLLLNIGHAADVRAQMVPPLPAATVANWASGVGTAMAVDVGADPFELGRSVDTAVRAGLDRREHAMVLLAQQMIGDDPLMAAVLSTPPTLALSNIGRLPAHSLPAELTFVRDDIFAIAPGMAPKLTVFTVGDRMTIQVEFDNALYSRARQNRLRTALVHVLQNAAATRVGTGVPADQMS
ncbi:hypothetical protein A5742_14080 [Mycolicibacterium fortuitum]|uniref:Phthiocerol/phthiodiolone dimycocerosyl transferase n=1 Tax=Mycolicibacterium fortuitum TaxID=1766 RepID=A0ABD6QCK0_MYCFO|nr:condensation domain-containing protein [Mycolicibacterium fortuitum]OMC34248.1 hypothetical protein A5742_14080 [Mycolicibacterium fortuitum]